jgi:hypothetical protein
MTDAKHTEALLPCPFCGGSAICVEHDPIRKPVEDRTYFTRCSNYGAKCPGCNGTHKYDTPEEAVIAWNTRHTAARSEPSEDAVECAAKAYAKATGYYVEFHRGLSSASADKIRAGIRAALQAAGATAQPGVESFNLPAGWVMMGVSDGSRNLFVYGPYDAIKECQRKLTQAAGLPAAVPEWKPKYRAEHPDLPARPAWWTYDGEAEAYYFAPTDAAKPPYLTQRRVVGVIDIAKDGTLAGIELINVDAAAPRDTGET